jgi:hypothetical protein
MTISFDQSLIDVWRQVLVENANVVGLDKKRYPVWRMIADQKSREVRADLTGGHVMSNRQRPRNREFAFPAHSLF